MDRDMFPDTRIGGLTLGAVVGVVISAVALFAVVVVGVVKPSEGDLLVERLRAVAPPQVTVVSAECSTSPQGVCVAQVETRFHSPDPVAAEYLCKVSLGVEEFACPGVLWLEGSVGTPVTHTVSGLILPAKDAPGQEPCAGLGNTDLMFCLHGRVGA